MSEINNKPIDQDPHVREFLNLDKAGKAPSLDASSEFDREFSKEAGVMTDEAIEKLNNYNRFEKRANQAKHRPSRAKIFAGGIATGVVLTAAAANGMFDEAGDAQKLADYDKKNQEQNIENNPDLFDKDSSLPENPADMSVTVEQP